MEYYFYEEDITPEDADESEKFTIFKSLYLFENGEYYYSFNEYDSMNEKCVSKSDNSGCELKRCTDLTSECSFLLEILDINAFLEIQDVK